MQSFGYTISVWSQDEKAAGSTRSLTGIFSPGTLFSNDNNELTNNTMCIWFEKIKKDLIIGISNIDIYTGKSFLFEYMQPYNTTPDAFDELERYMSIYKPSEIIVIHNLMENTVNDILHYVNATTDCVHIYEKNSNNPEEKEIDASDLPNSPTVLSFP